MPQPPAKQFAGIFVSYRRDDSSGHAGRLSDKLVDRFGKDQIFMDIDTIEPGADFVTVIENAVGSCEILIAIIGRHWLSSTGESPSWLSNPNDFVRLEIATALSRDVRVIPVLVQRATMPKPEDLPDDMVSLSRRNAVELSDLDWQNDVDQLIRVLEKILANQQHAHVSTTQVREKEPRTSKRMFIIAATVVALILTGVLIVWLTRGTAPPDLTSKRPGNIKPTTPAGMVYVTGGEFTMGRDDGDEFERPAHSITVKPFFIDQYEVTCEDYAKFVKATDSRAPSTWMNGNYDGGAARKPVTAVTWDDANAYARWAGKRLPTEEEWEFAARGTGGRRYPWGNEWQSGMANANGASTGLADAGAFKGASSSGTYDMAGNAWEWTSSNLRAYPGGRLPANQPTGELKVIRGGSYESTKDYATTTYRAGWPARGAKTYDQTGFRCVKDVP